MTLTLDRLRTDVAEVLDMAPEEIAPQDNLFDLGLDSMRLMALVMRWQEAEPALDFTPLWESATLADWQQALAAQGAGA